MILHIRKALTYSSQMGHTLETKGETIKAVGLMIFMRSMNLCCEVFTIPVLQVLTEYIVQDLNVNPKLPFEDNSFDVITNVVWSPFVMTKTRKKCQIIFSLLFAQYIFYRSTMCR